MRLYLPSAGLMFIVDKPNGECRFNVLWVEPQIWGQVSFSRCVVAWVASGPSQWTRAEPVFCHEGLCFDCLRSRLNPKFHSGLSGVFVLDNTVMAR